jgi:hypothetical protein
MAPAMTAGAIRALNSRFVDIPRNPPNPERDAAIKSRENLAGKTGFILGCIAAIVALSLNLYRAPRPYSLLSLALAILMAALNMPIGIMLGLFGEKMTRPKRLRPPPKNKPPR